MPRDSSWCDVRVLDDVEGTGAALPTVLGEGLADFVPPWLTPRHRAPSDRHARVRRVHDPVRDAAVAVGETLVQRRGSYAFSRQVVAEPVKQKAESFRLVLERPWWREWIRWFRESATFGDPGRSRTTESVAVRRDDDALETKGRRPLVQSPRACG